VVSRWILLAFNTVFWLSDFHYSWSPLSVCVSFWMVDMWALFQFAPKKSRRFLWAGGVKGPENHTRLCIRYALPRRSVCFWIEIFTNCRKNVINFKRSGKPSTSATDEKQEEAKAIILADRRVITEEIALRQVTVFPLVSEVLGFHKVSASLVSKHLTQTPTHLLQSFGTVQPRWW